MYRGAVARTSWSDELGGVSNDDADITSGLWDSTLGVWNRETGTFLRELLLGGTGRVGSVEISNGGIQILCGSRNSMLRIWKRERGKCRGAVARTYG